MSHFSQTNFERNLIIIMRQRTSLPLLKCKHYLIETNWDLDKAINLARNKECSPFLLINEKPY